MSETAVADNETHAGPARDPEEAHRALARIQTLLEKQRRVEALVHREQSPAEEKKALVEGLVHRQHLGELKAILDRLHPADIAYVLEALPRDNRLVVWESVKAEADGAILLEVSDAVRDTLIEAMDRAELVGAIKTLDADEIAALAESLPADVVEEVRQSLSSEERAQLRAALSYPDHTVGARMDFELGNDPRRRNARSGVAISAPL